MSKVKVLYDPRSYLISERYLEAKDSVIHETFEDRQFNIEIPDQHFTLP